MSDAKNIHESKLYSLLGKVQSAEKLFLLSRAIRFHMIDASNPASACWF